MKNERFVELLNLYLDSEISPEDLAELRAETRRNPEHQKMFLDYCRIYKACSQLGDSFEAKARKRSFKQVAYAFGGLAAAFALLGMAGRNLLPMINGSTAKPAIVQGGSSNGNSVFFPEIASSDDFSDQFFVLNALPEVEYVGVSNFGGVKGEELSDWNDRLILNRSHNDFGLNSEGLFEEDLLEIGAIDLQDPFNAFDEINGSAAPLGFSKAAFTPIERIELSLARDSRLNLK